MLENEGLGRVCVEGTKTQVIYHAVVNGSIMPIVYTGSTHPTRRATSMTHAQHGISGRASRGMTWIYIGRAVLWTMLTWCCVQAAYFIWEVLDLCHPLRSDLSLSSC